MGDIKLFKRFLTANILLLLLSATLSIFRAPAKGGGDMPIEEYAKEAPSVAETILFLSPLALLALVILSYFGLFAMKKWGRIIYTFVFLVNFILAFIFLSLLNMFIIESPEAVSYGLKSVGATSEALKSTVDLINNAVGAIIVFMSWVNLKDKFK